MSYPLFIPLHVKRAHNDFVMEPVNAQLIYRISPTTPAEAGDFGARLYVTGQPVSLMVQESCDDVMTAIGKAISDQCPALEMVQSTSGADTDGMVEAIATYKAAGGGFGVLIKDSDPSPTLAEQRRRWAEGLILQLPVNHDGRNSWLLNHGYSPEAVLLQAAWRAQHPRSDAAVIATSVAEVYRHVRRQTLYEKIGEGRVQASTAILEGDNVTIYRSLEGMAADGNTLWVRPTGEFNDGRFKKESV